MLLGQHILGSTSVQHLLKKVNYSRWPLVDSQLITGIIAHSCGAHLHTNNISKAYIPGASSLTIPSFACIRVAY
jgi:hypothetical protein